MRYLYKERKIHNILCYFALRARHIYENARQDIDDFMTMKFRGVRNGVAAAGVAVGLAVGVPLVAATAAGAAPSVQPAVARTAPVVREVGSQGTVHATINIPTCSSTATANAIENAAKSGTYVNSKLISNYRSDFQKLQRYAPNDKKDIAQCRRDIGLFTSVNNVKENGIGVGGAVVAGGGGLIIGALIILLATMADAEPRRY
jgi:hypothetical protein